MKRTNFHLEEAQAQKLRQALITIQRLRTVDVKNPIIMFPDEYYFVERTLIELGYLKPNKNQCAHTRFLNLMDELQVPFRIGRPTLDQLRVAANHITADPFPWQAAEDNGHLEDNSNDLKRWHTIYHNLEEALKDQPEQEIETV